MRPWNFAEELARYGPASARPVSLSVARSYCADVCRRHYENFTVASVLLPRKLLPHFHAVYAYCRWADDLADETAGGAVSLDLLAWWRNELLAAVAGEPKHPIMVALAPTIRQFSIPTSPFLDLLTAFEQDQRIKHYPDFASLLGYCQYSANPVGRLVLYLFECIGDERFRLSDEICTGLQLANFWQDVRRDLAIGRVYLPQEDLKQFGVSHTDLAAASASRAVCDLIAFEVQRTRGFFERGRGLLPLLPRRLRIDIDLFARGGESILDAIAFQHYDVLRSRPTVSKRAKLGLLGRALLAMCM